MTPEPAAVPATCEPCRSQSSGIGIRMRNRLVGGGCRVGVVAVADEIDAALDARRRRAEQRRVRRQRLGAWAVSYAAGVPGPPKLAWV